MFYIISNVYYALLCIKNKGKYNKQTHRQDTNVTDPPYRGCTPGRPVTYILENPRQADVKL